MNFTLNLKAFLRRLPLKGMSGHQKFLAIAAFCCKGKIETELNIKDIQGKWSRSLLGIKYNPVFYDRAQQASWVNPIEKGKLITTKEGINHLDALSLAKPFKDFKKTGSLIIIDRKESHTFDKFLRGIFASAKSQVLIADPWVDETIFDNILDVIPKNNIIKFLYSHPEKKFESRSKRFSQEFKKYSVKKYKYFHDRFLIVDDSAYVLGPSIKDATDNSSALIVVFGSKEKNLLQIYFQELWSKAK